MKSFISFNNSGYVMHINGYRISVQWGPGTYSDNYNKRDKRYDEHKYLERYESDTAEVMIYGTNMERVCDFHLNYCDGDTVARIIGCMVNMPDGEDISPSIQQIYEASQKQ